MLRKASCPKLPDFFETTYLVLRLTGSSLDTIENYRTSMNHWSALMGPIPLDKIEARTIAEFQGLLLKRIAPASVNSYVRPIKAMLRFAADEECELIERAPKIRMLREPKRVPLALTVAEFSVVVSESQRWPGSIGGTPAPLWWLALLLIAWETGLRYRALLSIRTVDFLSNSGGLYCAAEEQKDDEGQWFFLPPDTLRAAEAIVMTAEPLLFHPGVEPETVGRWFRKLLNQSGVYAPKGCGMRFHRLRKSKASYTEAAGGDAQRALGHSARTVTERYLDPRIVGSENPVFMPRLIPVSAAKPSPLYESLAPKFRIYG